MSRVGKMPVVIPQGVDVKQDGDAVRVKGPKGELLTKVPVGLTVVIENGEVRIARSRRTVSSDGSGARTRRPLAAGPARIAFANRSPLCSTSRTARSTTCRGQR